jgi:hypothetical protein
MKLGIAAAALVASTPSFAAVNVTYVSDSNVTNGTLFNDYEAGANNAAYTPGPGEAVTGDVRTLDGDLAGVGIGPNPGAGGFLSILQNSSYSVLAPAGSTLVSFLVGTLDQYNTVTLLTNMGSYVLNGREIFGQPINPLEPQNLPPPNDGSVTYTFGPGEFLTSIAFSTTQTAFEIDQLSFGTPEPGTWLMMILGFGLAGAGLRRRKQKLALA